MAPSIESWTETSLYRLIEAKFEEPAHVVLPQVANGSGHMRVTRYADAMAMSLWPSRGLELHGFEIKVSKSDWKRELRDPEKSAPIQAYCDRWWIVAPGGVVDLAELPTTWGLFEPRKRRGKVSLHVAKQAPKLTDTKKIDRRFLAAILRRVAEHKTEKQVLAKEFNRGFQEGMAMGRNDPRSRRRWSGW